MSFDYMLVFVCHFYDVWHRPWRYIVSSVNWTHCWITRLAHSIFFAENMTWSHAINHVEKCSVFVEIVYGKFEGLAFEYRRAFKFSHNDCHCDSATHSEAYWGNRLSRRIMHDVLSVNNKRLMSMPPLIHCSEYFLLLAVPYVLWHPTNSDNIICVCLT